jgi:hypothetical protein
MIRVSVFGLRIMVNYLSNILFMSSTCWSVFKVLRCSTCVRPASGLS